MAIKKPLKILPKRERDIITELLHITALYTNIILKETASLNIKIVLHENSKETYQLIQSVSHMGFEQHRRNKKYIYIYILIFPQRMI